MPTLQKFNDFSKQLASGTHNFAAHSFYWALTNTAPVATNTVLANITQIAAGNGYTTGGAEAATFTVSETGGTTTLDCADTVFTASGGSIATFRYAVLYNFTSASKNLVGWIDHGSAVTVTDTNTYTVSTPSGVLTVA